MHCYALMEISCIDENDAFYEQTNANQKTISRGDIVIAMGNLNAKVGFDNILLRHAVRRHDIFDCNKNGERFVNFYKFQRSVLGTERRLFKFNTCL